MLKIFRTADRERAFASMASSRKVGFTGEESALRISSLRTFHSMVVNETEGGGGVEGERKRSTFLKNVYFCNLIIFLKIQIFFLQFFCNFFLKIFQNFFFNIFSNF